MAKAKLTTYYVLGLDFQEEAIKATAVKTTAKLISFYRDETLVLAVPVSEIRRVGESKSKFMDDLEVESESLALKSARAFVAQMHKPKLETSN